MVPGQGAVVAGGLGVAVLTRKRLVVQGAWRRAGGGLGGMRGRKAEVISLVRKIVWAVKHWGKFHREEGILGVKYAKIHRRG